jgi:hypothetical protein
MKARAGLLYLVVPLLLSSGSSGDEGVPPKRETSFRVRDTKLVGGPRNDGFNQILRTDSGEYIAVGWSDGKLYLVKLLRSLEIAWERRYGRPGYEFRGHSIVEVSPGNCLVIGWKSPGGNSRKLLYSLVIDRDGKTVSEKTAVSADLFDIGGIVSGAEERVVVAVTAARENDSEIELVFLDKEGEVLSRAPQGTSARDVPRALTACKDGTLIVGGYSRDPSDRDRHIYLSASAKDGSVQWIRSLRIGERSEALSLCEAPEGGFLVGGQVVEGDRRRALLLKTSSRGEIEWQKEFRGECEDKITKLVSLAPGRYLALGETCSSGRGYWDMLFCEIGKDGEVRWTATAGGPGNDYANSLLDLGDGRYVIAGVWDSDGKTGNGWEDGAVVLVSLPDR